MSHPIYRLRWRPAVAALSVVIVSMLWTGCDNSTNSALNSVAADLPATLTDTFTDTLTVNGARTFPFVVDNPGDITAIVSDLAPDSSQIIGLSLGTWNGSACQVVLSNDSAFKFQAIAGHATTMGNFCVRVFDSTGTLPRPQTYIVTVTHP
jgi:hypothetical protein